MTEPFLCMTVYSNKIKIFDFICFIFSKSKPKYVPTCNNMFLTEFRKVMHAPISVNVFRTRHAPLPVLNYAISKINYRS